MEKASGVNLEETSGVGAPKVVRCCLQPRSGNSCNSFAVPLDRSVTCYNGNSRSSIYHPMVWPKEAPSINTGCTNKTILLTNFISTEIITIGSSLECPAFG